MCKHRFHACVCSMVIARNDLFSERISFVIILCVSDAVGIIRGAFSNVFIG